MGLMTPVDYVVYRGGTPRLGPGVAYEYLLAGNGVFKFAESRHLRACIPVGAGKVAGLPSLMPFFTLKRGRLPFKVLAAMLADARKRALDAPKEIMYHVALPDERIEVRVPDQVGSAGSLSYAGGGDPDIIMDVHSHCEMKAFFSKTDNRDEQGFRLYGVMGTIFTRPTMEFRVGVWGDFYPLSMQAIFREDALWPIYN